MTETDDAGFAGKPSLLRADQEEVFRHQRCNASEPRALWHGGQWQSECSETEWERPCDVRTILSLRYTRMNYRRRRVTPVKVPTRVPNSRSWSTVELSSGGGEADEAGTNRQAEVCQPKQDAGDGAPLWASLSPQGSQAQAPSLQGWDWFSGQS